MWTFKKPARGRQARVRRKTARKIKLAARRPFMLRLPSSLYFILLAFCLLSYAFARFAFSLQVISGRYEVMEIKPHVFVWVPDDVLYQMGDPQFGRAGTAGFIITNEGVVVVNTTNGPVNARDLLYEIRERTDQPIKYVINTDARGDHMLGNEVFVDQLATIISTSVALSKMRTYQQDLMRRTVDDPRMQARMRGIHLTLPTQAFDGEMILRLGGEEIRLLDLGKGASAGDAAVYLPDAKILFLGDLYENGHIPRRGLSDLPAWFDVLLQVENMDVEFYIPGEGPPGDKDDLQEFHQFLDWVMTEVNPPPLPENPPASSRVARMASVL